MKRYPKIAKPETPGVYLLDGRRCEVVMAYSRGSLMIADGPQSGMSVALVHGEWSGPIQEKTK